MATGLRGAIRGARLGFRRAWRAVGGALWGMLGRAVGTGARGEREAARHLKGLGYRVLARNARLPSRGAGSGGRRWGERGDGRGGVRAEADLVCVDPDGSTVVIVEVKSRALGEGERGGSGRASLDPERRVDREKLSRLRAMARALRRANRWGDRPVRIDVVAVELDGRGRAAEIRHHRGVGAG